VARRKKKGKRTGTGDREKEEALRRGVCLAAKWTMQKGVLCVAKLNLGKDLKKKKKKNPPPRERRD